MDTTMLARTRLAADDGLELYRQKTGEPVYLPLEPELANELRGLAAIPGRPRINWNLYADFHTVRRGTGRGDDHLNEL